MKEASSKFSISVLIDMGILNELGSFLLNPKSRSERC